VQRIGIAKAYQRDRDAGQVTQAGWARP
jgi:hypothetical protein